MIYMEKEVQGRSNNSLTSFRLENATYILHLLPFIFNDTFQQRKESFTRDVEIKMKHGQISDYTPNVTHLMISRKALSKECVDERILSFRLDFSTNK